MPPRSRGMGRSEAADVRSYVGWLLDHDFAFKDFRQRIKDRFPATTDRTITAIVTARTKRIKAAEQLNQAKSKDKIDFTNIPGTFSKMRAFRGVASVRYRNPGTGEFVTYRQTFDIPIAATKGEVIDAVRERLKSEINALYSTRAGWTAGTPTRYFSVTFLEFETF